LSESVNVQIKYIAMKYSNGQYSLTSRLIQRNHLFILLIDFQVAHKSHCNALLHMFEISQERMLGTIKTCGLLRINARFGWGEAIEVGFYVRNL